MKEAERLESFPTELHDFEDTLRRAANLHLEPDLNDGVVMNIARSMTLYPGRTPGNTGMSCSRASTSGRRSLSGSGEEALLEVYEPKTE
jgi:hypothetical protein